MAPLSPGAGVPSLALPALAGAAGEVVDSSALAFLAARAVQVREEEEAEELRQLDELLATAEDQLVEALDPLRHDETRPRWESLSSVEHAACHWYAAWLRREKRKRRKRRRRTRRFTSATVCTGLASVPGDHSGGVLVVRLLEEVSISAPLSGHYFSEPLVSGRHFLPKVWVRWSVSPVFSLVLLLTVHFSLCSLLSAGPPLGAQAGFCVW